MRQISLITYIIAGVNSYSLTSLSFSLSTGIIKTKKKTVCYITGEMQVQSSLSSEDSYKAETLKTPSVNVKYLLMEPIHHQWLDFFYVK